MHSDDFFGYSHSLGNLMIVLAVHIHQEERKSVSITLALSGFPGLCSHHLQQTDS